MPCSHALTCQYWPWAPTSTPAAGSSLYERERAEPHSISGKHDSAAEGELTVGLDVGDPEGHSVVQQYHIRAQKARPQGLVDKLQQRTPQGE